MTRLAAFLVALVCATTNASAITLADAANLPIGTQVTIDQALVINSTRLSLGGTELIQLRDDTRAATVFAGSDGLSMNDFLSGVHTGDVISFTATTNNYFGLFEFSAPAATATVVASPTINTDLDPVPVTPEDFDDFSPTAEGLESRYVELQGIELFEFSTPAAGGLFQMHTNYIARDSEGHETRIWARSQASVDSLNAHFGTIPAGYFDLPGIFLHAFDGDDPLPGTAGVNYLLNPVFISIPGDLNMDGFVGIDDLNVILSSWNQSVTPGSAPAGDPSNDGFVGIDDLSLVLSNWNVGTPPSIQTPSITPEPGVGTVLTLGVGLLIRRKPAS